MLVVVNQKLIKSENINDRKFVLIYNGKNLEYHKALDFMNEEKVNSSNDGDIIVIK